MWYLISFWRVFFCGYFFVLSVLLRQCCSYLTWLICLLHLVFRHFDKWPQMEMLQQLYFSQLNFFHSNYTSWKHMAQVCGASKGSFNFFQGFPPTKKPRRFRWVFVFFIFTAGNTPRSWRSSEHVLLVPPPLALESRLEVLKTLKTKRWEEAVVLKHHECLSSQPGCLTKKIGQTRTFPLSFSVSSFFENTFGWLFSRHMSETLVATLVTSNQTSNHKQSLRHSIQFHQQWESKFLFYMFFCWDFHPPKKSRDWLFFSNSAVSRKMQWEVDLLLVGNATWRRIKVHQLAWRCSNSRLDVRIGCLGNWSSLFGHFNWPQI